MGGLAQPQPLSTPNLEHLAGEVGIVEIYRYGHLVLFVWLDQATPGAVQRLKAAGRRVSAMGLRTVGLVHSLTPDRPMPDPDTRRQLVQATTETFPPVAYSAYVLNGSGFWASAIRATLNGMRLLIRRKVDMRLDAHPEDTAAWLPAVHRSRTGQHIPAEAFVHIVRMADDRARHS